ncbi:hypothetical protein EVC30_109 [Rhizobium phage RHph_Y1_11]|nr:hypothetical protein EVC30_109 [Rhizobium phage RHph_Y1_11]
MQQIAQNNCGSCNLCCKLLGITEIKKEKNRWCGFCDVGKGCKIYDNRPPSCQEYQCMWLASQETPAPLPIEYRPDKSKVVITSVNETTISAHVDPGSPHAWKAKPIIDVLNILALQAKVLVSTNNSLEKILLEGNGASIVTQRRITMTAPDADGVQYYNPNPLEVK